MMILNCLAVGLGGFAGSICRYLMGLLPLSPSGGFPVKTLIVNVAGAFLIGGIAAAASRNTSLDPRLVLLLKAGFCGGFTTFSTFALELTDLMQAGSWFTAAAYAVLSMILGVLAVLAGELVV